MKNFTTIFPTAANVHLSKDIGQVANTLGLVGAYRSTLVCFRQEGEYSFLKSEAKHLKIDFIEHKGLKLFMEKSILDYIEEHAKNIDVLNFFQLTKETIYYGLHYKKHNPKGKIYIKLDIVNQKISDGFKYSKKKLFNWYHKRKEAKVLDLLSVISVENPTALHLLKKHYPAVKNKAMLLTNGVNDTYLEKKFPVIKSFEEKENIILAVGRIGAVEKKYELLLEGFAKSELEDWKLIFVGPIEHGFDKKVEEVIRQRPHLRSKIELTGSVDDRDQLYEYYNRSKICCLTSGILESFGIVFIESMYFGNYIIGTTPMSALQYITDDFQLGSGVEHGNINALVNELKKITGNQKFLASNYHKAIEQIKDKFYWTKIVTPLITKLNG